MPPGSASPSERSGLVLTVSQVACENVRDVGAAVAEPGSAPSNSHDDRLRASRRQTEAMKDDRIPSRGCESNNGILE